MSIPIWFACKLGKFYQSIIVLSLTKRTIGQIQHVFGIWFALPENGTPNMLQLLLGNNCGQSEANQSRLGWFTGSQVLYEKYWSIGRSGSSTNAAAISVHEI